MTDQLPERIWAKRGFAKCCDGVWDEPVDMDGNPMGDEDMDDDDTPYLRDDTAIPRAALENVVQEAVKAELEDAARWCEHERQVCNAQKDRAGAVAYRRLSIALLDRAAFEQALAAAAMDAADRTEKAMEPGIERRVQEAVEAERERCARIAENYKNGNPFPHTQGAIAAAIRGEPTE